MIADDPEADLEIGTEAAVDEKEEISERFCETNSDKNSHAI